MKNTTYNICDSISPIELEYAGAVRLRYATCALPQRPLEFIFCRNLHYMCLETLRENIVGGGRDIEAVRW